MEGLYVFDAFLRKSFFKFACGAGIGGLVGGVGVMGSVGLIGPIGLIRPIGVMGLIGSIGRIVKIEDRS